jgi:hypothetical protein
MANFILYGYAGDVDFAEASLTALARIRKPGERIIYLDDVFEPTPDNFKAEMQGRCNVEFVTTYHPRNGNLIGPEHTKANFSLLEKYSSEAADGVCVKVDCDTLVLSRAWLDEFIADESKSLAAGFHSQPNYMFGLCYAIKNPLAKWLCEDVVANPPWMKCFEDYEISYRVHAKWPERIKRFALAKPHVSRWYCVNPSEIPQGARADVLDVNRGAPRQQVLDVMRGTVEAALAADKKQKESNNEENPDQCSSVGADQVCSGCTGGGSRGYVPKRKKQPDVQAAD